MISDRFSRARCALSAVFYHVKKIASAKNRLHDTVPLKNYLITGHAQLSLIFRSLSSEVF